MRTLSSGRYLPLPFIGYESIEFLGFFDYILCGVTYPFFFTSCVETHLSIVFKNLLSQVKERLSDFIGFVICHDVPLLCV